MTKNKIEDLKKEIEDVCKDINNVEYAGIGNNEDKKFWRKLQKRKMYLKAKLKGYQEGFEDGKKW